MQLPGICVHGSLEIGEAFMISCTKVLSRYVMNTSLSIPEPH